MTVCGLEPTQERSTPADWTSALVKRGILRHPPWDALFLLLALSQGAILLLAPSIWLMALGLWWNANTISHNFIHGPFFRSRAWNRFFSAYLSLLLGIPQTLWRDRHLAHHAGDPKWRLRMRGQLLIESGLVLSLWLTLAVCATEFFCATYLPGFLIGLGLCHLQGYYEHARGATSHYGRLYNVLFFNDGYHLEHHARPAEHWTHLPRQRKTGPGASRWPAVLRWLEALNLDSLERWVLQSTWLQRFVLRTHEHAFRKLVSRMPGVRKVAIIGGGIFPRTALVLQRVLPAAKLKIIEANAGNILRAKAFLDDKAEFVRRFYDSSQQDSLIRDVDLLVIPLAFKGDRQALYRDPPAPNVLIHDWLWRRRGDGVIISLALLKRLNLVQREAK